MMATNLTSVHEKPEFTLTQRERDLVIAFRRCGYEHNRMIFELAMRWARRSQASTRLRVINGGM